MTDYSPFGNSRFWQHFSDAPASCRNQGLTLIIFFYKRSKRFLKRLRLYLSNWNFLYFKYTRIQISRISEK